jgi:peptide chain release factor 2
MVKDLRTGYEVGQVSAVMDGDLDGFIEAYLKGDRARGARQGASDEHLDSDL